MKLPGRENALVSPIKLRAYLLSETHSIGKAKAKVFRSAGFNDNNTDLLKQGLLAIARTEEVKEEVESEHGNKYVVEGDLKTPAGRLLRIRTVWIVDTGQTRPRFVTAYPASQG